MAYSLKLSCMRCCLAPHRGLHVAAVREFGDPITDWRVTLCEQAERERLAA
jgi:hypothetical protein